MDLLVKAQEVLGVAPVLLLAVVVVATLVVRLTPSPKDDAAVGKVSALLLKVCAWLPTIGVNPETKKLKEALEEAKKWEPKKK